jgi:hypothetical protein
MRTPFAARSLHGALAALGALGAAAVFWGAAWLLFWIANTHANEWFERVGWLDVAFGAALVCAFVAVLAAWGVPGWALVLAGAGFAGAVFGPLEALVPAVVVAAVAAALGTGGPRVAGAVPRGLAIAAAALVVAPALALRSYDDPGKSRPPARFTLAPAEKTPRADRTARRAAHRRATPPAPAPAPAGAARFLRDYYAELRRDDFAAAWSRLSPAVRASFGGFEPWRDGFGTTVSQRLADLTTTDAGTSATVTLTLHATDRDTCGATVRRRFAQTWTLTRRGERWQATDVRAEQVAGPSPCA